MLNFSNDFCHLKNKKILLRERKRHTDRRLASPGRGVDRQTDGQTRVKTLPSPILRMRSVKTSPAQSHMASLLLVSSLLFSIFRFNNA